MAGSKGTLHLPLLPAHRGNKSCSAVTFCRSLDWTTSLVQDQGCASLKAAPGKMSVTLNSVLISDAVDPSCVQLLEKHGIKVTCKYKLPKEQLLQEIKGYDGLIVRSDTKVTADVLSAGTSLRVVGRAGTGVDNIDIAAATRKGIIVLNTPGGNSISACELTCAHITGLARNVAQACQSLKEGRWDRKLYTGSELSGKTLAILGLGRIGREVAIRMQSYGMKTIGFDPIVSAEAAQEFNVKKMELEEIWPQADYITVHTPLIPQTRNLINDEVFNKCKKGVKIINVARGGIIDEAALLRALQDGRCGGAGLDVFCEEPPKSATTLELIRHPAVVATPHLGASTSEAQQRVAVEIAEQFIGLATNCSPEVRARYSVTGVVNAPVLAAAMVQDNIPWITLANEVGKLASRIIHGAVPNTHVSITTAGPGMKNRRFLETAVLVGVLSGHTKNGLNLINAPSLAQESGIHTSQLHSEEEAAAIGTVTVTVKPEKGFSHSLKGMVKDGLPHLLAIDDASFGPAGLLLEENILFFQGQNSTSNIMEIVKSFAEKSVQIATLSTARGTNTWIAVRTVENDVKPVALSGITSY